MKRNTTNNKATLKMRLLYYLVVALSSFGLILLMWTIASAVLPFAIIAGSVSVVSLGTIVNVFQKMIDGRYVSPASRAVAWAISVMTMTVGLVFLAAVIAGGHCPGFFEGSMSCVDYARLVFVYLMGSPAILIPFVIVAFAALVANNAKPKH